MRTEPLVENENAAVTVAMEVVPRLVRLLTQVSAHSEPGVEPLTMTQYRLLRYLEEGPLVTSVLADRLEVTPAAVSTAIDGLVRRGMVRRLSSSSDRRVVPLQCTPQGHAALVGARARQHAALSNLFATLSPQEVEDLTNGLHAVRRALAGQRSQ